MRIVGSLALGLLSVFALHTATPAWSAEELTPAQTEFFEKDVRPILVNHCYDCHSPDDVNGGLLLDSRAGLLKGGDTGPAIVPGDPDKSLLIEAVRYQNRDLQMPPQNALSAEEIATLEKWVAMGAPDPRVATTEGAIAPTGMSIEDGREFWSFQPVAKPAVPEVDSNGWVRTPIDAFVLSRLQSEGVSPAPQADRRSLIRRVTFNLTGLPPTPAEVEAFVNDSSPDAFAKVVERLLASPHYGVRWGRHWLDVARYADSNGLDENLAFGTAWRYRDYVINAFNHDKPYDQFLVEQLAGDLLPAANRETKTATGFLVLGAKVLAEPDDEKLYMDTIDEQLDTIGKAFLGMTFGCVRCHDHKFDPLKQTDYYALAAIFKSTRTFGSTKTGVIKHWNEHSFATEEELANLKTIDAEIAKRRSAASKYKREATDKIREEAQSKAVEYLVAATQFPPSAPLTEVAEIAEPLGLHPRILHHCRLHLDYHQDDEFFKTWHEHHAEGDVEAIRKHYAYLFKEVAAGAAGDPERADDPNAALFTAARDALFDRSGFLAVPPKPEFAFDDVTLEEYNRLMDEARVYESHAPDETTAMGVEDGVIHATLPIHIRGSHRNLGKPVAREFPEVMRTSSVRPIFPADSSGRLQLAQWMASTQHPLTARVYVNRIWRWHFGEGLVSTTENFGALGDRPSHPELLDWLAYEFMQSGWSTKHLHRLILNSSVYQLSSSHPAAEQLAESDPDNRMLARFPLMRLEAEQLRDAMLAVAGQLDESIGGKTVPLRNRQFVFNHTSVDHTKYDSLRRAAYLPVIRNNLYTLFEQFDFPDPTMPTGSRSTTTVAPQALFLMNAPLVIDAAEAFADQVLLSTTDDSARVIAAYERALGRRPSDHEVQRGLAFVGAVSSAGLADAARIEPQLEHQAWTLFCQSLFASNEFLYLR